MGTHPTQQPGLPPGAFGIASRGRPYFLGFQKTHGRGFAGDAGSQHPGNAPTPTPPPQGITRDPEELGPRGTTPLPIEFSNMKVCAKSKQDDWHGSALRFPNNSWFFETWSAVARFSIKTLEWINIKFRFRDIVRKNPDLRLSAPSLL